MSDVQDMTSLMAKELMQGIRDNVEDIAAAFKKMAIINPDRNREVSPAGMEAPGESVQSEETKTHQVPQPQEEPQPAPAPVPKRIDPQKAAELAAILEREQKKKRAKKVRVDENQLSLFDHAA